MPAETHVERGPLDPDEVLALVRDRLAEIAGIDDDRVVATATLVGDLGLHSTLLFDVLEAIEEDVGERTVGFVVDDEDLADLHTVGDLVDYVVARTATDS